MKALLLGAGFSYDLGMPIAKELTDVFLDLFNEKNTRGLINALSSKQPYGPTRPINKAAIAACFERLLSFKAAKEQNYEMVLSHLQDHTATPRNQSDKDSCGFVFGFLYEIIYAILSLYQVISYEVIYPKNLKWFSKLENLLSDQETWVFSLNHDLYMECLAIDLKIPLAYGSSHAKFFPVSNLEMHNELSFSCLERTHYNLAGGSFLRDKPGINLIKLHGGLSEIEYDDKKLLCNLDANRPTSREFMDDYCTFERMGYYQHGVHVVTSRDRFVTNREGKLDVITKAMLMGGGKYSRTAKPKAGEEKLILFDEILAVANQLTIIGYGFGDMHVNYRISAAMARNTGLSVEIIDPNLRRLPENLEFFDYDSRIKRAHCGAAHWMDYCKSRKWDAVQMADLTENAKLRPLIRTRVESALRTSHIKNMR